MISLAKQLLDSYFPQSAAAMRSSRYRRELNMIFQDLVSRDGKTVQTGPFKGLIYALPGISAAEIYHYGGVPKLLGCYEAELHGILTAAAIKGYDT